jgi:hypothetical protein
VERPAAERYYRKCVGAVGMGIRLGRGSGITMRNNRFAIRHIEQMDVEEQNGRLVGVAGR